MRKHPNPNPSPDTNPNSNSNSNLNSNSSSNTDPNQNQSRSPNPNDRPPDSPSQAAPEADPRSEAPSSEAVSSRLEDNRQRMESRFAGCGDLEIRPWRFGPNSELPAFSVCFDTLVRTNAKKELAETLRSFVFQDADAANTAEEAIRRLNDRGASSTPAKPIDRFDLAVQEVLDGQIVVFFEGWSCALGFSALEVEQRQASEPITEPSVHGPHVSTIESIDSNIGVIRNLLKSSKLKFVFRTAGEDTRRRIAYGYMDGIVQPETLAEFEKRVERIGGEEILETSYLEEWIGDSLYSPFPQVRYTERPDTAVASLLGGKIIALVEGSPSILICPGRFLEFFMASEDYYYRPIYSTLIRWLRVAAFLIALMLPSTYIALSTFHSELIPTVLLLAILNTREGIPFPALVEALIMEFFFELLREAGIRLPRPIGSAVSIVGALVIGQAAIQSQIASPVMVIVVALTGIASFALPQYNMAIALRILRFPLMLLAATFGGLGIMAGVILVYLHLATLRSLGQPYLAAPTPQEVRRLRDAFIVLPRRALLRSSRNRRPNKEPMREKSMP
ncbi:spore germination protein [Cohnella xylanilytica]|nr:spore germination protein [Cohnella xylanilytica]GIO13747.1 spore germination protein [Cohnella xylanilytica]